jgi:hypothetical protein
MMETVKNQTYENIVTIVHADDPRDEYVAGDIIIRGSAYNSEYGNGTYNLYNNRLLQTIPTRDGWYHFIDDDDMYADDNVIERLVASSLEDHVNIARVQRWNTTVCPRHWGSQKTFQTECFFMHCQHKDRARWWGNKNGDHNYSRKLTDVLPINWIDNLLICKAQVGKGHGRKLDLDGKLRSYKDALPPHRKVACIGLIPNNRGPRSEQLRQGEMKFMRYDAAYRLEREGVVKITHYKTYIQEQESEVKHAG